AAMLAVDTGLPFAVVAASLAVSFACYARFFSHPGAAAAPRPRHPGGWSELVAGVRHVVSDRFLTSVVITLVGVVIAAEVVATVTAPYVRDGLASDAWAQVLGALRSTAGGFAIIAALSAGTLARRFGRLRVLRVMAAAAALSPALMATGAQVPPVLAGLVVAAVGEAIWVPLVQGGMMRRTPAHLLARTRAAVLFVMWGSLPVTSLVGGTVSEAVGVRPSLLVAAAVALVTCSLGIWRPGLGTDGQPGGGAVEPRTTSSGLSRTSTGVASASSMSSSNRSAARGRGGGAPHHQRRLEPRVHRRGLRVVDELEQQVGRPVADAVVRDAHAGQRRGELVVQRGVVVADDRDVLRAAQAPFP